MRSVESEGRTVDLAISRALEALGAGREAVHVDILEGDCPGVLGFGKRQARVRATIRGPVKSWLAVGSAPPEERPVRAGPPARVVDPAERGAGAPRRRGARHQSRRQREQSVARSTLPSAAQPAGRGDSHGMSTLLAAGGQAAGVSAVGEAALEPEVIIREIMRHLTAEVTLADSGTIVVPGEAPVEHVPLPRLLTLIGPEIEEAIGRRGELLEAMEYLLNRMLDRRHAGQRVALDAQGYRTKRRAVLEETVKQMAARAREQRRAVTLDPMGPGDRRIVHEIITKGERGIAVRSIGQGFYRKQTLTPEGARSGGRKQSR